MDVLPLPASFFTGQDLTEIELAQNKERDAKVDAKSTPGASTPPIPIDPSTTLSDEPMSMGDGGGNMAKSGKEETAEGSDPGSPKSVSEDSADKSDDEASTLTTATATVETEEAPPTPDSVISTASFKTATGAEALSDAAPVDQKAGSRDIESNDKQTATTNASSPTPIVIITGGASEESKAVHTGYGCDGCGVCCSISHI
jgi:hypothetical protein